MEILADILYPDFKGYSERGKTLCFTEERQSRVINGEEFLIFIELLSSNDRNVALTMTIPEAKHTKETKHPYPPALHTPTAHRRVDCLIFFLDND